MSAKKTLVIGASDNPSRYSYLALKRLKANGHPVIALGKRPSQVDGTIIETEMKDWKDIDTVTLYINPLHQEKYYEYILSLKPKRIIFNPGTENDALIDLAEKNNIQTLEACTLVMLSTGQY